MATGTNTSASKIAAVVVLIPILVALWYALPWFLPMWRWQNVDFEKIAKDYSANGYTTKQLEQEFEMIVWYNPRKKSKSDPCPYQIYSCTPPLKQIYPMAEDEDKLLVRIALVNDRDGFSISDLWIGMQPEERLFKIKGWRLPPGSLDKALGREIKGRQVVLYQAMSMEKVDLNKAIGMTMESKVLENDDDWEERFDGFDP
jgi:hypothetical protein